MGVVRRLDEELTVNKILLIGKIAEEGWSESNSEEEKKELELTITFAKIAFCVSLWWEDVSLIVIEGLNMFWKETQNNCIPYMMMTFKGRYKGKNNLRWHCVPLEDQTKSGIPTTTRISRILYH